MKKLLLFLTVFCFMGIYTGSVIAESVKDSNQLFRRGGNNSEEESSNSNNLTFNMMTCNSSLNSIRQIPTVCNDMEILYGYRIPYGCTQFPSNAEKTAIENIVNNLSDYLVGKGVNVSTEFIDGDLLTLNNPNAQQNQQEQINNTEEQVGIGSNAEAVEEEDNDRTRRFSIIGMVRNTIRGGINIVRNILPGGNRKDANANDDEMFYDSNEGSVNADNESQYISVVIREDHPLLNTVDDNSSEQLDNISTPVSEEDVVDVSTPDNTSNITDENFCEIQKEEFDKLPRSCIELQFAFHCKSPELTPTENNYFFDTVINFTRLLNYKYTVTTLLFKRNVDNIDNVSEDINNNVLDENTGEEIDSIDDESDSNANIDNEDIDNTNVEDIESVNENELGINEDDNVIDENEAVEIETDNVEENNNVEAESIENSNIEEINNPGIENIESNDNDINAISEEEQTQESISIENNEEQNNRSDVELVTPSVK